MTIDEFWEIIDRTRAEAAFGRRVQLLDAALRELPVDKVRDIDERADTRTEMETPARREVPAIRPGRPFMRGLPLLLATAITFAANSAHASFVNYSSREINVKIVYYGPATAGLAETLKYIYGRTNPKAKGKLISLATETERTLFFDFVPLNLGEIRGFKVRFHLYTVPGHVRYNASRKLILKGVDGVVFVADASPAGVKATRRSWENLKTNLAALGYDWKAIPLVVQLDGTRSTRPLSPEKLRSQLKLTGEPLVAANWRTGVGVFDTLKAVARAVLIELKRGTDSKRPAGKQGERRENPRKGRRP